MNDIQCQSGKSSFSVLSIATAAFLIKKGSADLFKVPPQIPGRKSVDEVGSDGVGHAKHAREDSPDVSPGFEFNKFY